MQYKDFTFLQWELQLTDIICRLEQCSNGDAQAIIEAYNLNSEHPDTQYLHDDKLTPLYCALIILSDCIEPELIIDGENKTTLSEFAEVNYYQTKPENISVTPIHEDCFLKVCELTMGEGIFIGNTYIERLISI